MVSSFSNGSISMLTQEQVFTPNPTLASRITYAASHQTYYTVFFLVDHGLKVDAYKAYAYFRWLDDQLDKDSLSKNERLAFVKRENALIDQCYGKQGGIPPHNLCEEEYLLVDLIRNDSNETSGLQLYIQNLMAVMVFDAERRGELINQQQLTDYEKWLATAVTEALHFYIGHDCRSPQKEQRYLAATGAHITHMLRDTFEDNAAGYYNIPIEQLEKWHITPQDITSEGYRNYVKSRVDLARSYFQAGKQYLAKVENLRCRLAGYSYIARFTPILNTIERDGYLLRPFYR
jgi:phytoene/squalene synthetase